MAADLNLVLSELRDKVLELLELCSNRGCVMRPSTGLRDPYEQGRLWRQSRSIEEITEKINEFRNKGAVAGAECNTVIGLKWAHIQLRHKDEGVLDVMSLQEVNDIMSARFG